MTGAREEDGAPVTDDILVETDGPVLTVTFNRPQQRNAMTWAMYEELERACERADTDDAIRVMVLRGAGDKAFVAGTDIRQFASFRTGADGIAYEQRIGAVLTRLQNVDVPTIAAIDGYCVGGGLGIASCADIRIATPAAKFGVPIARTLGNCLAGGTLTLLTHQLGQPRATSLLLTARMMLADEALACGFVTEVTDDLDAATAALTERLAGHAPLSMWATKESIRRLRRATTFDSADIVDRVYGSDDFHNAVAAFANKQSATWTGH
jgi:enoyl-CoA hydratase/carnithine racemase